MAIVPTLLIGLGGIGSKVVDEVYHLIPEDRRDRIAVHSFDTNVNDISALRYLTKEQITQTSARWTVRKYLHFAGAEVHDWFPHEVGLLKDKLLTEGAGQVRAVSRLAYRAALQEGRLKELQNSILPLFQARADGLITSTRVMIVSTLAGGTGAGLFLQLALFLRAYLGETFGQDNVLIRGAFLLPDILTLTGTVPQRQWDNLRANGYACIKELDAVLATLSGNQYGQHPLELEFQPGRDPAISGKVPYDFVYLYDFENDQGNNVATFENYRQQVVQSLFLQLFTPISKGSYSIEDNEIIDLVANQGQSRFCGAGVARLVYPYQDILDYTALRWCTQTLSDEWLRLDRDFEEEYRQYERDVQAGIWREEPTRKEVYLRRLRDYATDENPNRFFKEIYQSCHLLDERNRIREDAPLTGELLTAIEEEIERMLQHDILLMQAADACNLSPERLKNRDFARGEVRKMEEALVEFEHRIGAAIHQHKVALISKIVTRPCDSIGQPGENPYQLHTLMMGTDGQKTLHPVAVRYVLYDLQRRLEALLQELAPQNNDLWKRIRSYQAVYNNPDTPDYQETALDSLQKALQDNLWKRLISNNFSDFVETYESLSRRQLDALQRFKLLKLRELVFDGILDKVKEMLSEDWEPFFFNLKQVSTRLHNRHNMAEKAHEGTIDPTTGYVLSTVAHKQRLWEDVRLAVAPSTSPAQMTAISKAFYLAQYGRFCKRHRNQHIRKEAVEETASLFEREVLWWCRNQLKRQATLRLNIVAALQTEAQWRGEKNVEGYITQKIKGIDNLARPFVPPPGPRQGRQAHDTTAFWGIHPDSLKDLSEEVQQEAFSSMSQVVAAGQASPQEGQAEEVLARIDQTDAIAFSRYELIRYRTRYGLRVEDFPKMLRGNKQAHIPPGAYYAVYQKRIEELLQAHASGKHDAITPHLDKRWHLEAYMPGPVEDEESVRERQRHQAFVLGLIYGYLRAVPKDRGQVWQYLDGSTALTLASQQGPTSGRLSVLDNALRHEPSIVNLILQHAEAARNEDFDHYQRSTTPRYHRFCRGAKEVPHAPEPGNIMDTLFRVSEGVRGNRQIRTLQAQLFEQLLEEVIAYFDLYYGEAEPAKAGRMASQFMADLWAASTATAFARRDAETCQRMKALLETCQRELNSR